MVITFSCSACVKVIGDKEKEDSIYFNKCNFWAHITLILHLKQ